jgi:hypothetical protein
MVHESSRFQKNRKREFKEQLNYWNVNIESGLLRLAERVLLGFNVSDVLAGDLGQIQHLREVSSQVKERRLLENPLLQNVRQGTNSCVSEATSAQFAFEIHDAHVDVLTGLIVLDAGFVVDSTLAKWQKIVYRGGIGSSVKRTKKSKHKLNGSFMVLPLSPYFYHTLIDEMPNLLRIRDEFSDCNTVIVHQLTPRWAVELLTYFKFNVRILKEKAIVVERLFAVSAPRAIVRKNLEYLRREISPKPDRVIVVSRKGTPRSDDQIEQEILNHVEGSVLIDPSDFTVDEQIKLFSNARVVIGLHGGALTNCIWMDHTGKLIEIFNHAYRTSDYERLCTELGITYCGVETLNLSPKEVGLNVEKIVNGSF